MSESSNKNHKPIIQKYPQKLVSNTTTQNSSQNPAAKIKTQKLPTTYIRESKSTDRSRGD